MKYVVGVVPGGALEEVTRALGEGGIYRLTVGEVDIVETRTSVPPSPENRRLRLEIAVNDEFLPPALLAFDDVRRQGYPVWVSVFPLDEVARIRTGERGRDAI